MHDDNLDSAPHRSAKPGEVVTFGIYPQTEDGVDRGLFPDNASREAIPTDFAVTS